MRTYWPILILLAILGPYSAPAAAQNSGDYDRDERRYPLPRRTMPLEKALIKLREAGAELGYRPDQLPQITIKVPGGKRTLGGWLSFLLRGTEITYERTSVGYLLYPDPSLPQQRINVYGLITDATSGERLIGATVQLPDEAKGTAANEYGFYTLPANGGRRKVRVTYVGYQPLDSELVLLTDTNLNFALQPDRDLPAVIVQANTGAGEPRDLIDTRNSVGHEEASRTGSPGGEADPLRVARLLPGVESGADGLGGLFIRGSDGGHNLVLLDGVPLYQINHAAGLFSIFNNEAIRRLDLYKEGIPTRFGGRIGGVLDVHTRDGSLYDAQFTAGTSMLAANVTAQGPIQRGRSSFLVSSRYFWTGALLRNLSRRYKSNRGRLGQLDYQVYDVNFKFNQSIGNKGRLYVSGYRGVDGYENDSWQTDTVTVLNPVGAVFRYAAPRTRYESVAWTNNVGAVRYNHVFNSRLFGNFRLSYSGLDVNAAHERADSLNELTTDVRSGDIYSGRYGTGIQQVGIAFDGQYTGPGGTEIRFGVEGDLHRFTPQLVSGSVPLTFHPQTSELSTNTVERAYSASAYGSVTGALNAVTYRIGLRAQWWVNGVNYLSLSPRILIAGPISESAGWRLTYDRSVQPVHLVGNTVIGLPSDVWVPSTAKLAPSTSSQVGATYRQGLGKTLQLEASLYYRNLENLVSFTEATSYSRWEDNLSQGDGFARGLEITLSRNSDKFRGWASYVLAQSRRRFGPDINFGRSFDFRYGRTHGVKLFGLYMVSPRVSVSATWRYGSGANYSLSEETFLFVNPARLTPEDELETVNLVKERNGVRLPANHRLDVNAQISLGDRMTGGRFRHTLNLGVYNVYSRHNPFLYDIQTDYFSREDQLIANREFVQVYLAPITPTVSYQFRFGTARR